MRALPTTYRGITFRSRLEARWGVFFDSCGIRWEYEPVGYSLAGRLRRIGYLADFWLPDEGAFIEIKPPGPFSDRAIEKATRLARDSGHPVYVFSEPWWPIARAVYLAERDGWVADAAYYPPETPRQQLLYERQGEYQEGWTTWLLPAGCTSPVLGVLMTADDLRAAQHQVLANAYGAARAMRFEAPLLPTRVLARGMWGLAAPATG